MVDKNFKSKRFFVKKVFGSKDFEAKKCMADGSFMILISLQNFKHHRQIIPVDFF